MVNTNCGRWGSMSYWNPDTVNWGNCTAKAAFGWTTGWGPLAAGQCLFVVQPSSHKAEKAGDKSWIVFFDLHHFYTIFILLNFCIKQIKLTDVPLFLYHYFWVFYHYFCILKSHRWFKPSDPSGMQDIAAIFPEERLNFQRFQERFSHILHRGKASRSSRSSGCVDLRWT